MLSGKYQNRYSFITAMIENKKPLQFLGEAFIYYKRIVLTCYIPDEPGIHGEEVHALYENWVPQENLRKHE